MLKFSGGAYEPGVSRAREVEGDNEIPQSVDVVIVGGGFVGCCTALELAERGMSVALCEKGVVAGEASGRAAGLIEYEHLAPIKMEMLSRSMELWRGMSGRIDRDIGYNGRGLLTLYDKESHIEGAQAWLDSVKGKPGVEARIVSGDEAAQIDGSVGSSWCGGLYQPNGAAVEPRLAAPAIAEAAREKGAKILQNCAVRAIQRDTGKITGVMTEKGLVKASKVVLAGGLWSPMMAKQLGLNLPQIMVFAEQLSVEPLKNGPELCGMTPAGYFRGEPDGGYMFGATSGAVPIIPTIFRNLKKLMSMPTDVDQEITPVFNWRTFRLESRASKAPVNGTPTEFEKNRIFQPEVVGRTTSAMYEGMCKYVPAFKDSRVREHYAGALMSSLDNLGVISPVKEISGLFLGTGMLYGLTLGPAAGEAIADMITGEETKFDVTPYRYERFIDGSKFEFYP